MPVGANTGPVLVVERLGVAMRERRPLGSHRGHVPGGAEMGLQVVDRSPVGLALEAEREVAGVTEVGLALEGDSDAVAVQLCTSAAGIGTAWAWSRRRGSRDCPGRRPSAEATTTPSTRFSALVTRPTQDAQVMPPMVRGSRRLR